MKTTRHIPLLLTLALLAASCNVSRQIAPGQSVLYENRYEVKMQDSSNVPPEVVSALNGMKNYTVQKPNTKLLGIKPLPFSMGVYCLSNPSKDNWWHNYLRRQGQAPVVYNENSARRTAQQLTTLLESKGCFGSTATFDTLYTKRRYIAIGYNISATQRYRIKEVSYHAETPAVNAVLNRWSSDSYLKVDDFYDQDKIAQERTRIIERLQDTGYYMATKELVTFEVDTAFNSNQLTIDVYVNNPKVQYPDRTIHTRLLQQYHIRQVHIDTNTSIKPKVLQRATVLHSGQLYRPRLVSLTYNSLNNLKNFKYVDIRFEEAPTSNDSIRLLDADIRLLNSMPQKLSLSLELSNASPFGTEQSGNFITNGNFGIETVLEYQNKNLFGGAELFKAEGSLLLELPKLVFQNGGGAFHEVFSAFEAGLDLSLDVPQFLFPFINNIYRPHTLFSLGGNYQYRTYFERLLANTSFGYTWRANRRSQQQFIPVEFTYVRFFNLDPAFWNRIQGVSDLRLKYQYSDHFVMDARYDYTYSSQQFGTRHNFQYLHASVETAGNLLEGLGKTFDWEIDENGFRQAFGVPYAQYVKFNLDAKSYFYHGEKSIFVTRLMLGIGLPYHNSLSLPYEKSFFGGGPTTMRAWQLRRLGPGGYSSSTNDLLERVGDMTLVLNLEERFHIASIFEGALFADIGNVWLTNESDQYPDGAFHWDSCLKDMAVGVGLGLRLNISILTLRVDFAIPMYNPGYEASQRWRVPHWKFNQIVTNLGIDYPF